MEFIELVEVSSGVQYKNPQTLNAACPVKFVQAKPKPLRCSPSLAYALQSARLNPVFG